MPFQPFNGQLDDPNTSLQPFNGKLDDGSEEAFKSGTAFQDTKSLIPSMDDLRNAWDTFKKQWENRHNTPITQADIEKLAAQGQAERSGILDTIGGLPAMIAGGVAGLGSAAVNLDASKGLQTGMNVMNKLLPSSLMGNEADQQNAGYKAAMAPVTAAADVLNAVPTGYGEILNAMGAPKAAQQVTDLGKLGIMAGMGFEGAKGLVKGLTNPGVEEHANKLITPETENLKPFNGELDQPQASTQAGFENVPHQQELFQNNPYDVAGHVTALEEGRPATIDNPQGDLLGGQDLEKPVEQPVATTSAEQVEKPLEPSQMPQPENNQMELAMKQAQEDAAYKQQDQAKQAAYDELQMTNAAQEAAQRQLEIARQAGELDYQHAKDVVNDKSLMPQEVTAPMQDALRTNDLKGALDTIAQAHPDDMYRQLASYLSDRVDGVNTTVHPEGYIEAGDRQISGYFDPTSNTVGFSGVGSVSPHTVMHETVHSLTSQFLDAMPNDPRVMAIKDAYNKLDTKQFPSVTNVKEFVAEAFSNPDFQSYLKTQRVNNISLWQRFVNGVKNIFGFKNNTISNALDHVIDLSKQVIEASDLNTRTNIMEQFKNAGMTPKMADLMASRPKDIKPSNDLVTMDKAIAKMGLERIGDQWDMRPKDPQQVVQEALNAPDIKAGVVESIKANLDAGGMAASLRHNNNPVVKATFAYVDEAMKNYDRQVRELILDKQNGLKTLMQKLSSDDLTVVHSQMMLDEGQVERTPQELAAKGWSQAQIDVAMRLRQIDKQIFQQINETRAKMNPPLEPMTERIGHLAGRFVGDFYHMIYEKAADGGRGDPVMRVHGSTKWGAQKLADFIQKEHPEWEVAKQEYNAIKTGVSTADRFNGFRELLNYIGKNDEQVGKALDTLDKYNKAGANNFLNVQRHGLDKKAQAGGLVGSEGNKFWQDAKTNAEEGFKAHLAYLDSSIKWSEMQKAMDKISQVTVNPEVMAKQQNAIKWSTAYTDHALNRNQGFLADFANRLMSETGRVTGLGHTNVQRFMTGMGSAEMRAWMGLGNIPFTVKHLMLPFQKMPGMLAYMKLHVSDASLIVSGMKSLESYYHYLKDTPGSGFDQEAAEYARRNNVFNVDLSNTSGKIMGSKVRRTLGKLSDLDFSMPEHAIRGTGFFFFAHLLKDAGMETGAALSAAEHLTRFLYTDYASHESPRFRSKGGFLSQLAFQVTQYKMNELSQIGFFNRERIPFTSDQHTAMQKIMSNTPLMTHLASTLAFSGVTGMLAYKEADEIYRLYQKYVMKTPDNLMALLQRSGASDSVKYGLFSRLGIDSKINESELLPAPFPTTSAEINQLGVAWNAVRYHDMFHMKQLALSATPSSMRGLVENKLFTGPEQTTGPHKGEALYQNPNTGEGRVYRDAQTRMIRNFGYHTTKEQDETNLTYAIKQIQQDHSDLAAHVVEKAKGLMASSAFTPQVAQQLAMEYAKHQQEGDPDFATALTSYAMKQHTSQREQLMMRDAKDKMGNSLQTLMRNK